MKIFRIYSVFLLLLAGWSCREVYYPEDIESDKKIPVIKGTISKDGVPEVKIYWALKYNSDIQEFISGAEVYVEDNYRSVQLSEYSPGHYTIYAAEMIGEVGNTYTLSVVLPGGKSYRSIPQRLTEAPVIDSLYAAPGLREVYTYSTSNKPILQLQEGLNVIADLSRNEDNRQYYRFQTTVLKMMVYTTDIGTPNSHSIYLWESNNLDNSFSVDFSVKHEERQVLLNHQIGYLRYFYDASLENENQTAPYTEGWVVTSNVYSISADVYDYYNSIARQLRSNNQIFAPVAAQIKSNITCTSDPKETVIGVFDATSRTTVYKAFGWTSLTEYKSLDLPFFPQNIPDGISPRFAPYFWVYF